MKLIDFFEEQLPTEEYILEEGIFKVSPAIAFLAFKDNVVEKINKGTKGIKNSVENKLGKAYGKLETKKANILGKSGNKDSDTVYKYTPEQKQVLAYVYRKYGKDIVEEIDIFRKEVLAPYQVIKRNVEKTHSLTNKEVYGMTKEEYYKYRESGRKKIEKRGTYFKDAQELRSKTVTSRDALEKAKKALSDFKAGRTPDLTVAHMDRVLDELGIGEDKLYGWTDQEFILTTNRIKKLNNFLLDPKYSYSDEEVIINKGKTKQDREYASKEDIKNEIKKLEEKGYYATYNKKDNTKGELKRKTAPFKQAYAIYLLRRGTIKDIRKTSKFSEYKDIYIKVLTQAIKEAEESHKEKLSNYTNLKSTIDLNSFEKKIWGKKLLSTEYTGNINDWYLKIKPEDFFKTEYREKGPKVLQAEKEIDAASKRFERELKKTMSDEDVALCKKYRLFNNLITVKQLKNSKDLFKSSDELKKDISQVKSSKGFIEDFDSALDSAISKEYNSIRDLEDEQNRIKELSSKEELSKSQKEKLDLFLKRIDPKGKSNITKITRQKFSNEINNILDKEYTGKTEAEADLKRIEDLEDDFKNEYGSTEYKQFEHNVLTAKQKINTFLNEYGERK